VRIGLFGGSFDPPHTGHIIVAQDAIEALGLDVLLVIPAAQQPLKGAEQTAGAHRLAMVRACFGGLPKVVVDPVEITRGGLSFMVDTVEDVRGRWPHAQLHLLVGRDVVPTLTRWKDPERLLGMVRLVVLYRDTVGAGPSSQEIPDGAQVQWLATRRVDLSSTEVRTRVRDGRSIRGFVPESVASYIESTGLYLENSRTPDRAET
jgi:nicotinate-nucleotide adenylyltransferase